MRAATLHLGVEGTTLCKVINGGRVSKEKASIRQLVVEYAKPAELGQGRPDTFR